MRLLFELAFWFSCSFAASGQSVILGVLEDVPPVYVDDTNKPAVRVLFQFDGGKWIAFPSDCSDQDCLRRIVVQYPAKVRWSIGLNGRQLAKLSTRVPQWFDFYSHVGLQDIDEPSQVPKIGSRSVEFGGFTGEAVYHPLVANSEPFFSDPDHWRGSPVPANIQIALHHAFRRANPKLCKRDQTDETKSVPFGYTDAQVRISKALKSKSGVWIAELHLDNASACDDVVQFDEPWFVVRSDGSTKYIGEGMWLVDVGDFNNDGRSEILFSIGRYNRGGYELFYDQFAKHVSFEFSFTDRSFSLPKSYDSTSR
jgi:hypothetical protein